MRDVPPTRRCGAPAATFNSGLTYRQKESQTGSRFARRSFHGRCRQGQDSPPRPTSTATRSFTTSTKSPSSLRARLASSCPTSRSLQQLRSGPGSWATPDTDFATPNNDTLYLGAAVDLGGGPVVLSVPDTDGRYYVLQFVDAWTNNFAYVGRRATGTEAGTFLLTLPGLRRTRTRWSGSDRGSIEGVRHHRSNFRWTGITTCQPSTNSKTSSV